MNMSKHLKRERGYTTVMLAPSILMIVGSAGLAIDIGRVYYIKSEMQNFADSASIFATMQLDGTANGIAAAQAAVTTIQNIMKWDIETKTVPTSNITVTYARGMAGNQNTPDVNTWTTNPDDPTYYRFVQVSAWVPVPLTFMGAFNSLTGGGFGSSTTSASYSGSPSNPGSGGGSNTGNGGSLNVGGTSQAGQTVITNYPAGLLPFSPIAWSPNTPDNFGLTPGTQYTLRYPSQGGQKKMSVCPGDVNASWIGSLPSQDRGYWGSTSSAALRGEIIDDQQLQALTIGQVVPMVGGNKNTEGTALAARVAEDSDTASTTFAQYTASGTGNGRRVIGVPINSGPTIMAPYSAAFTAIGIGAFFLLTADNYNSITGSDPICGEYLGPYLQGKTGPSFAVLSGVFQFGYAFYAYNALVNAVRNGARYGSNYPYSSTTATPDTTILHNVQNLVVYGRATPADGAQPVVAGLTTSNVAVVMTPGNAGGITPPTAVTVSIVNFSLDAVFGTINLNGRPFALFPYTGILTPPAN